MDDRKIVFLIHGIDDTSALFHRLQLRLQNEGWIVHTIDLIPNDGRAGLDELADQVAHHIEAKLFTDEPVNLVGFSMGGLVARFYVQRLAGSRKVSRLITISAPHWGTWTAYLRWNKGARQMRPNSDFLRELNCAESLQFLDGVSFACIWTPLDLMIRPATSSIIAKARSHRVHVLAHALMMRDKRVLGLIQQLLAS